MINVTKTFLPPMEEYTSWLQKAWDKVHLTNNGQLLQTLEAQLKDYLGIRNIIVTTNGTLPLQIAVKLFAKPGDEIITTPFSYVATSAAIVWESCKPVFVDIHPEYLTIDETKIEAAITPRTKAIMATHVFGNPCNVEAIAEIAARHNLKVIYDAAHCFGVRYKDASIFTWGDVSTCSFHATKLFHTGEGGAMMTPDDALHRELFFSHNFGHSSPTTFHGLGINAKTSELQAAMGLAVLPYISRIIAERRAVVEHYDADLNFSQMRRLGLRRGTEWNYAYYPVVFESEAILLKVIDALAKAEVAPRRYFYPSLNTIEYTGGTPMPVSESIAGRIICLPLYAGLDAEDVTRIISIVNREVKLTIPKQQPQWTS